MKFHFVEFQVINAESLRAILLCCSHDIRESRTIRRWFTHVLSLHIFNLFFKFLCFSSSGTLAMSILFETHRFGGWSPALTWCWVIFVLPKSCRISVQTAKVRAEYAALLLVEHYWELLLFLNLSKLLLLLLIRAAYGTLSITTYHRELVLSFLYSSIVSKCNYLLVKFCRRSISLYVRKFLSVVLEYFILLNLLSVIIFL